MPGLLLPQIPAALDTPAFRQTWEAFVHHRKHDCRPRCPLSDRAAALLLRKLAPYGPLQACHLLEQSIIGGWRGVIFRDSPKPGKSSDQLDREQRDAKQRQAANLRERERSEADARKRVETVKGLPTPTRERLHLACVAAAPEKWKQKMAAADPCGGGLLTQLIYAKWMTEGGK